MELEEATQPFGKIRISLLNCIFDPHKSFEEGEGEILCALDLVIMEGIIKSESKDGVRVKPYRFIACD
jgi:hypothetical protein